MNEKRIVSEVAHGKCKVLLDNSLKLIWSDEGFERLTGYAPEDIANGTVSFPQLFPQGDFLTYVRTLRIIFSEKADAYLEHRIRCKDGRILPVYCYGFQAYDDDNQLVADIVMTDISEIKHMQERYHETEHELELIINSIPGGVAIMECGEQIILRSATDEFYRLLGHTSESYFAQTNNIVGSLMVQEDFRALHEAMKLASTENRPFCLQTRLYNTTGEIVWFEFRGCLLQMQDNVPLIYTTIFDVTESKHRDEALRMQTEQFQIITDYTNELLFDYNVATDTLALPRKYDAELSEDERKAMSQLLKSDFLQNVTHPEDYDRLLREVENCMNTPKKTSVDLRMRLFSGDDFVWHRILCCSVEDEMGKVSRVFGRVQDIDKEKKLKRTVHEDREIIERLSTTDSVTGLLNRAAFKDKAKAHLAEATEDKVFAIVYSDINDFSYVNDNFGYDSGNTMLFEMADIIKKRPATVCCSRINSDFFVALVEGSSREEIEQEIRARDSEFYESQRKKYPASELMVCTGICFVKALDCDITVEIDNANLARRKAKQSKGTPCCVYYDDLRITRTREKIIAAELHGAIANRNIELFLQPKFLMDSREVIGAEALVRWRNADGTYRMPVDFIEVLEKVGYIVELDFFMYEEALKCLKRWKDNGLKLIPISVNFSRLHNNYSNFVDRVIALAEQYKVDSRYVELEVTESAFATDMEQMALNMSRLRERGFLIDIDDFGKGYSSLSFLIGSPVDTVKVDKAFVDNIETSDKHREYIKQMCMLIQATDKEIIFEGVETQQQADFLCGCGFRKAQGWLLDKAVPVPVFEVKYLEPDEETEA